MNILKAAAVMAAVLGATILAPDADAHGRYRSSVGIYFGVPAPYYYYPRYYPRYYYYPQYYYPPAVYGGPAPSAPVFIEQSPPAPAPSSVGSGAYWYYCRDSQTYYPYVQQCASPWQQVTPNSGPRS